MAVLLQLLAAVQETLMVVWHLVVAGLVQPRLTIHGGTGAAADRNANPFIGLPLLAVEQRQVVPAAVLCAEILGQIREVDQLRVVDVRIGAEAGHDICTGTGVGDHRKLGSQIFPAHEVHLHVDAGGVDELLGVGLPIDLVWVDELGRSQHVQRGALLDLEFGRLHIRGGNVVDGRPRSNDRDRCRPKRGRAKSQ